MHDLINSENTRSDNAENYEAGIPVSIAIAQYGEAAENQEYFDEMDRVGQNLDFFKNEDHTFVFSPLEKTGAYKGVEYTGLVSDCLALGVIAEGQSLESEKSASFLSHFNPENLLTDENIKARFQKKLRTVFSELKATNPKKIKIAIGGGLIDSEKNLEYYSEMIGLLDKICREELGCELVVSAPKTTIRETDTVYLDSNKGQFSIVRRRARTMTDFEINRSLGEEIFFAKDLPTKLAEWRSQKKIA